MKNSLLFFIKSKIVLNIKGNNIERFIKRLKSNNIEIISIKKISNNEIDIVIFKEYYETVLKLKTIYEVETIAYRGFFKYKSDILNNKFVIIFILIGLIVIYILSNIIFSVDIITNDSKMEEMLIDELNDLGIKKYKIKLDYDKIQKIKRTILSNHKDELEWIEIESIGTKYIVRYEPRVKNIKNESSEYRNIIAKKDCIIKSVNISKGRVIKDTNTFVKKGDIIVSGYIDLNGNIKDTVRSSGTIYGEVWYKVSTTYPYKYSETKETGKIRKSIIIQVLNKEIELFTFNKFKTKRNVNTTLIKDSILPIKLLYQLQYETIVKNEENTKKQAITKALIASNKKIEEKLKDGEYIKEYKILNMINGEDSITLNVFYTVIEDVTEYQTIEKYNLKES